MKKSIKIIIFSIFAVLCAVMIALGFYLASIYSKVNKLALDEEKLTSPSLTIEIFDSENKPIKEENTFNHGYIKSASIPDHTKAAFVSIEDKSFYEHSGINYKRIAKAVLNNLKSKSLKEGASTISQQLIKNTHLTSEKTFERKIKEIALAKKLENRFSKEEILEQYLNVIYFGNNCYGIENASNYYFSKSAHDLNLEESALLAGMIKSPNRYSPVSNYTPAFKRRNVVLEEMCKDGIITQDECFSAKNKAIKLNLNTTYKNKLNSYSQAAIDEACKILSLPAKQIALHGFKIYTYQNEEKQKSLEKAISAVDTDGNDNAAIVIDNAHMGVVAYTGESAYKILEAKRQPGSCIKPVLVYAPALNEDIIYPCTQILDEKTTISGYSPKNVSGSFKGYVSAREALSKSINIPAVKVLSYLGIPKAKAYASDMGIEFDEKDDSYALALGGMNYGTNLLSLAGAYSTFANSGVYSSPKFISYITDKNNKIVYIHKKEEKRVLREDASYLLTDMLRTCSQSGTAKKLNELKIDIASKTGTVGKPSSSLNLDAWNISYTNDYTCGCWIGNLDNTPISFVGGNHPTQVVKNYFTYENDNSEFKIPSSIVEKAIDLEELSSNHRVVLANNFTPERYTQNEMFSNFNLPRDISNKFVKIESPEIKSKVSEGKATLTFDAKEYLNYEFYKNGKLISSIKGKEGKSNIEFEMNSNKEKVQIYTSYIGDDRKDLKEIELVNVSKLQKNKWYV